MPHVPPSRHIHTRIAHFIRQHTLILDPLCALCPSHTCAPESPMPFHPPAHQPHIIYIQIYIHTRYMHTHTYIHTYMHTHMHSHIPHTPHVCGAYPHIYKYTIYGTSTRTTCTHKRTYLHTHITHAYMIHTCAHIHTPGWSFPCPSHPPAHRPE